MEPLWSLIRALAVHSWAQEFSNEAIRLEHKCAGKQPCGSRPCAGKQPCGSNGSIFHYTPLSESRSGPGGLLEDIGPILGPLGVMVSTI